ncbi:ABC transporter substrate-binding protein [Phaeobacter sp. B1627]|uniref:ABC transporter substrate-binding protein n=1 Tax=Phaeobacter sp. B1627 TaxID=2583809 RepID=UPI001119DEE3|nr:ABC transporter substrate-binding protein [Phaeobacter sp. B1627]TNJ45567.1 peptide ABC transporter substrate-binding protein [Phaeobacter sp. B1627]
MSRLDRRALFSTGAAAALLAATGASLSNRPRRGGTLRFAVPRDGGDLLGRMARSAVYDQLTEVAPDGVLRGELATGWRSDDTAREWHVELQPGVKFHDGTDMTGGDVVASLEAHAGLGRLGWNGLRDIRQSADGGVTIALSEADPHLPYRLADARLVIAPGGAVDVSLAAMSGTGLYQMERAQDERHFRARRLGQHYKDGLAGWFDALEFIVIPDAGVRAEALRDGYVDIAALPRSEDLLNRGGFFYHPSAEDMMLAAASHVAKPTRVSTRAPFDDHRIAERWWMS